MENSHILTTACVLLFNPFEHRALPRRASSGGQKDPPLARNRGLDASQRSNTHQEFFRKLPFS